MQQTFSIEKNIVWINLDYIHDIDKKFYCEIQQKLKVIFLKQIKSS